MLCMVGWCSTTVPVHVISKPSAISYSGPCTSEATLSLSPCSFFHSSLLFPPMRCAAPRTGDARARACHLVLTLDTPGYRV